MGHVVFLSHGSQLNWTNLIFIFLVHLCQLRFPISFTEGHIICLNFISFVAQFYQHKVFLYAFNFIGFCLLLKFAFHAVYNGYFLCAAHIFMFTETQFENKLWCIGDPLCREGMFIFSYFMLKIQDSGRIFI